MVQNVSASCKPFILNLYNIKAGYTQHMLLQHNTNEAANLMCEQCAFSTPSKEMLKRHIKNKHELDKWNR